jgi:hypothetical protein
MTSEIHWTTWMRDWFMKAMEKTNLLLHVVKGVWGIDGKAYEDDV